VSGTGYEPSGDITDQHSKPISAKTLASLQLFFETAALASNARISPPDSEHPTWQVIGDPTEGALITLAQKAGLNIDSLEAEKKEIKEFQFDSGRKLMSSIRTDGDQTIVFVKGAPEAVLSRATHLWDQGHHRKLTAADRQRLELYNETHAKAAHRNLAMAYKIYGGKLKLKDLDMNEVESDLIFLGIASMVDPLREQVPSAMLAAQNAHVKVSIITGDYATTAEAIARQAKLGGKGSITVVAGEELPNLHDSQILELIERGGTVFSRVAPEDKLRIVEIAKHGGKVVAVTGDGINDAPALKRADIGVAMGLTGTDVAKQAAEIVLLDDSFHSLVGAIEQGRLTFKNIKKAARCALTDNAGELLIIMLSLVMNTLLHIPLAITAIQILAIDVIAEMFPITALGWDTASSDKLMRDKPRRLRDHILNRGSVREFAGFGLLSAVLAYGNFLWFFDRAGLSASYIDTTNHLYMQATTLTYVTLVLCQFINLLLVRTDNSEPFFTKYLWSNKKLLWAFGISIFCILNLVYNPVVQPYVRTDGLSVIDWLTALLATGVYLLIRLFIRNLPSHSREDIIGLHHEVHGKQAGARV
jgi:Ca2+-transporting ATPase